MVDFFGGQQRKLTRERHHPARRFDFFGGARFVNRRLLFHVANERGYFLIRDIANLVRRHEPQRFTIFAETVPQCSDPVLIGVDQATIVTRDVALI